MYKQVPLNYMCPAAVLLPYANISYYVLGLEWSLEVPVMLGLMA